MPIAWPALIMRGPGVQPSLIAFRNAMSSNFPDAPTLRTVVNPAIKVARAFPTLRIAANDSKSLTPAVSPIGIAQHTTDQVCMRVDEARHQSHVTEINHPRVCGNVD